MKILFLASQIPYPPDSGGKIITFSILKDLLRKQYDIDLIAFAMYPGDIKYKRDLLKLGIKHCIIKYNNLIAEENKKQRFFSFLTTLLSPFPYKVKKYYMKDMHMLLQNKLASKSYDELWLDDLSLGQYINKDIKIPIVFIAQNENVVFFHRMLKKEPHLALKLFSLHEYFKYLFYQKRLLKRTQQLIVMSKVDRFLFSRYITINKIKVLRSIHNYFNPHSILKVKKQSDSFILLFIGSLLWYPNRDGVRWFLESVFPKLQNNIHNIKFWVVGEYTKSFLEKYKSANVKFWGYKNGYKKKLDFFYRNSDLFVIPIRYGSGIRVKALEALSWKLPIISTPIGMEGLKLVTKRYNIHIAMEQRFGDLLEMLISKYKAPHHHS